MKIRQHLCHLLPRLALIALTVACMASPLLATSWVRVADHHLVGHSPVIVEAVITDAGHQLVDGTPYIDYQAEVKRVIKGSVDGESTLTLRSLGGPRPDGTVLHIWGTPSFHRGERALLFLEPWDDGSHRVLHLFQGAFHVVRHEGRDVAYRNLGAGERSMQRARPLAPETPRDLAAFTRWIAAVDAVSDGASDGATDPDTDTGTAEKALPAADYRLDLPVDELRAATEAAIETAELEKFTLLALPDGRGFRWRAFDSGTQVSFRAHEKGQSGLAGGGFQQVRTGINTWNNDPGSDIFYRYAGTTTATGGFKQSDGVSSILFDDLEGAGEFDAAFSCTQGGVLAKGGPLARRTEIHMVNGERFLTTVEADIVTNKNAACYFATASSAEEVFTHELGHTLGFGHSCGDDSSPGCGGRPVLDDAIMRAQAHSDGRGARLNSDDRAVAAFVYGSVSTPPTAPGGLTASANADFSVSLAWNDNSDNEDGFAIDRRGVGEAFEEVATTGRNVRAFRDATAPSGSRIEYRIRAFNGAGQSGPSNVRAVTTLGEAPPSPVLATAVGPSTVLLEWTDNAEGESGFEIEVRDLGGFGLVAELGPNATSATIENLLVETEAAFRIRSVGEPGASSFSDEVAVTTLPFEPDVACDENLFGTCLNRERFRVISRFRDFDGISGASQVSPVDSDDSGIFYFFGEENWEILVKVLDGCGFVENPRFWVFAAATTTVEYSLQVIDTWTGETAIYLNPLGLAAPALTDTDAFDTCEAEAPDGITLSSSGLSSSGLSSSAEIETQGEVQSKTDGCVDSDIHLCLNQGRFRVEAEWTDFDGVSGMAETVAEGTDDSGLLWFFGEDNWEILVKVLDGCPINDHFWVFAAGTTNVQYTLTVTDTVNDISRTYANPLGQPADTVTDVRAFPTCD